MDGVKARGGEGRLKNASKMEKDEGEEQESLVCTTKIFCSHFPMLCDPFN